MPKTTINAIPHVQASPTEWTAPASDARGKGLAVTPSESRCVPWHRARYPARLRGRFVLDRVAATVLAVRISA